MKKIIFLNIFIILLIYVGCETYCYYRLCERVLTKFPVASKSNKFPTAYLSERFLPYDVNKTYKDKPVLMMGCSYTYGENLQFEESPSVKLGNLTGRHVYNTGVVGHGIIAQIPILFKQIHEKFMSVEPEYVIYTYMFHHPQRFGYWDLLNSARQAGIVPFQKYDFLYKSFIWQYTKNIEFDNYMYLDCKHLDDFFFAGLEKVKKLSDKAFPGSKFVMLIYSDINKDLCNAMINTTDEERLNYLFDMMYSEDFRKKVELYGIKVIYTHELIGRKMDKPEDRIPSDIDHNHPHPSSAAWDKILPALVKKLDL